MAAAVSEVDAELEEVNLKERWERKRYRENFGEVDEVNNIINELQNVSTKQVPLENALQRFTFIMDQYQEQPHLLDPHLDSLLEVLLNIVRMPNCSLPLLHAAFKCLYLLTKVRGYKVILRHLPHEVSDLEPVLALLQQCTDNYYELDIPGVRNETWYTRYMLVLWLSIVIIIPFDISRFDSGDAAMLMIDRIFSVGKTYLSATDKTRDAAAYLISKFITRPDVGAEKLGSFCDWCLKAIGDADESTIIGLNSVVGNLTTLALIFKYGKRNDLLQFAPDIVEQIAAGNLKSHANTLIRKLTVKVVHRIGLTFLKPKIASWRYTRGSRSLAATLSEGDGSTPAGAAAKEHQLAGDDEEYDIPDDMEIVIDLLLNGLKDKDTIVRWSAAKGVGRVTARLPQQLADDVVGSVLELFRPTESDSAWHGGCLSLAELGRRGLLLPERLSLVVPIVLKALMYDERRGNFSIGAHVRDAACYVCWSFARAYDPLVIKPHVQDIASALVTATVFDREINCRRAAAAAFQENVGRQGQFPHGIEILTTADYYAVGSKTNAFLILSVYIAQFEEYTQALINHLVYVKLGHWDQTIRHLTSRALHNLTAVAPDYMAKTVLPTLIPLTTCIDLDTRHGAILATAEVTHALVVYSRNHSRPLEDFVSRRIQSDLKSITNKLQSSRYFKGLGGDIMAKSVCVLIDKISLSQLPFHDDDIIQIWLKFFVDCLKHNDTAVQLSAVSALPAFFTEYFQNDGVLLYDLRDQVLELFVRELQSQNESTRMGFSLALGALPKFMLTGKLKLAMSSLIEVTNVTERDRTWAHARRDAIKALTSVCDTVGIQYSGDHNNVICEENISMLYNCYLTAMQDYTLDNRGDVGAWAREAAMAALKHLMVAATKADPRLISLQICEAVMCALLQETGEKIDRSRAQAGDAFMHILHADRPEVPHIPHRKELLDIFPWSDLANLNWHVPAEVFPRITQLLRYHTYTYSVLAGLLVSVGGLTESLVKNSAQCLFSYLKKISDDLPSLTHFCDCLLKIFKDYQKVDRITIPLFKTLDQLLGNGCFDPIAANHGSTFLADLTLLCRQEITNSSNPRKIMTSADVFCGLLQFEGKTRKLSLSQLLMFLCHPYPRVRKTTSNKLYEAFVVYDGIVANEKLEDVMNLISETEWDESLDVVRPIRNQLCGLLGVAAPKLIAKKTQ